MRQAVRGAELVGGRPVLPFAATFCALPFKCYSNGSLTLEPWAVEMVLTLPYQEGAAGAEEHALLIRLQQEGAGPSRVGCRFGVEA